MCAPHTQVSLYSQFCSFRIEVVQVAVVPNEEIVYMKIYARVALGRCYRSECNCPCTCPKHARTSRRIPFRCCSSPHSLRVARTLVSPLSPFAHGAGAMATFETDALKITLAFGTLLRSAAGAARCFATLLPVVIPLCTVLSDTRCLVASSRCLSGPDLLFWIDEAVVVDGQ